MRKKKASRTFLPPKKRTKNRKEHCPLTRESGLDGAEYRSMKRAGIEYSLREKEPFAVPFLCLVELLDRKFKYSVIVISFWARYTVSAAARNFLKGKRTMNLYLSEKLKSLRKEQGISQEKLAQYLNISFQAVSKWETGVTTPDISLLPDIARFYGITVDELLQVEKIDEEKLYREYEKRSGELFRDGKWTEALALWQEAYQKMPRNHKVKEMLMSSYFDVDKKKYQKEIIELGEEIYQGNYPSYYKGQAISQIARTYAACGNHEMAEKWAFRAFPLMHSREMLFMQITDDGEEMLSEFRFANYWYLNELFYMSTRIAGCENIPGGTEYVQAVSKAVTQMYELVFPNDDMNFEDLKRMCVQHRMIAEDEIALSKNEEVIKHHLTRALECAEKSVSVKDHDLSYPLVMGWHVYDAPSDNMQIVRLIKKELAWQCFDEYRNRDWFIELLARLDQMG